MGGFEGTVNVPRDRVFDRVRADISGVDWQITGFVEADYTNGMATIELPETLPDESLSKAYRDTFSDYAGFWPVGVSQITDPEAKVAGLKDIIAYRGDERVGRIYLADRRGSTGSSFVYFHFADRPFILSGYNLTHPGRPPYPIDPAEPDKPEDAGKSGGDISYRYVASFAAGWNAYVNISGVNYTTCTTVIFEDTDIRWYFETWP